MEARTRASRLLIAAVGLCLSVGGPQPEARASGVDGAGRTIVIPLVMSGPDRVSLVTLANPGREPIEIDALYVPAKNTPVASNGTGARPCPPAVRLDPDSSETLALDVLCPVVGRDVEDFGYLELHSKGDSATLFMASAWAETSKGRDFAVEGYPVGSFDSGRAIVAPFGVTFPSGDGLRVSGLYADRSSGVVSERLFCYVASLQEPKTVFLVPHVNGAGTTPSPLTVKLRAREMQRVDLTSQVTAGQPASRVSGISVDMSAGDAGQLVGGCAVENVDTRTLDFQPAHTPFPKDASRVREFTMETGVQMGPYQAGDVWRVSPPAPASVKVVLSTYVQPDDDLRCNLAPPALPSGNGDPTPWLELRVVDPDGVVRAGGNGAKDTGVFSTGPRNALAGGYRNRWLIEIGPDEDALAQTPFGLSTPGTWAVHCKSAAGMSIPLTVWNDSGALGASKDDF